jgi:hypothetical protein
VARSIGFGVRFRRLGTASVRPPLPSGR